MADLPHTHLHLTRHSHVPHAGIALQALACVSGALVAHRIVGHVRMQSKVQVRIVPKLSCEEIARTYHLTARERDVLTCLASEMSLREVSEELHIAESTVRVHVHNICRKTGCDSLEEALGSHLAATQQKTRAALKPPA